ncbi:family 78 glycoside hydrolase catalytic domain [Paenibacillus sp. MBLB4367]|uniref:family 78 glycoside hydrolase catalytic domain n=1 Tax=Paenibacillus sp. MBLB4367 TaxID=3384767 RepID=UPI0039080160
MARLYGWKQKGEWITMQAFGVYDLRCDYKKNPLGTDERRPRLSWKLSAAARDVAQSAYRIQVSKKITFEAPLWDTDRTAGDRSVHIVYEGPELESRTRYYYRVNVWDRAGNESGWSEAAYWETALLSPSEWTAEWITAQIAKDEQGDEPCHFLRKEFLLQGEIRSARIYATSLGLYRLFLNGKPADDTLFAPGWTSYNKRLQYQTYDVTALLGQGENAVGIMLGNGWYKGNLAWANQKDIYGSERAALLQLHVAYADGREEVIVSDGSWTASSGPVLMSEIYHGETYDAREELAGWNERGYDAGDWMAVTLLVRAKDTLIAQENEPCRIVQELRPIEVIRTPNGETVLDMGQNMVGWMRFTAEEEAGTVIRLMHAEVLDREGNFYIGNLRSAKQTVSYTCKGTGAETYEPFFSFQGFRYVKVEGMRDAGDLSDRFVGCVIHTDMEQTGTFRCSDELVNQLQSNIFWGQKGNFLDVPTDCPQRDERLGWTGDAQVFIRTAAYNMNVVTFFEKWLKDLAADQLPNGGVPVVIPHVLGPDSHSSAAWADAAVICPWTLYECYGDTRALEAQYESMKAWVEYMRAQGENEFLWNTGKHYGDWLALDARGDSCFGATPHDLIATAFFAYSSKLLAKAADALGKREDASLYEQVSRSVAEQFRREFVTPSGRVAAPTQTAYVLALMFDLLEERDRERAAATLAKYITDNKDHLTTGFVGTPYLCFVLSRFGYTDLAYRLVLQREYPSWLYSVTKGATTIWEHWDGIKPDGTFWSDSMNSYNHYAYGAVGDWLYRVACGIDTDERAPGYKRIRIAPQFGETLTFAEAAFQSVYGEISVKWDKTDEGITTVDITIPANTDAEVVLPGAKLDAVLESGTPLPQAAGIRSSEQVAGGVRMDIGSGTYRFLYTN